MHFDLVIAVEGMLKPVGNSVNIFLFYLLILFEWCLTLYSEKKILIARQLILWWDESRQWLGPFAMEEQIFPGMAGEEANCR